MNQSEILAITCNFLKALEKSRVQGAIGFGFVSRQLKNAYEIFKPITKRTNRVITFDSRLKLLYPLNFSNAEFVNPNYSRYNIAQSIQNDVIPNTNRTCIALFVSQCPSHIFRLLRKKKFTLAVQKQDINQSITFLRHADLSNSS